MMPSLTYAGSSRLLIGLMLLISPATRAENSSNIVPPCATTRRNDGGKPCPDGYRLNPDGVTCADIDMCAENLHECSHFCNNFCGGYSCSCPDGMDLLDDKRNCYHPPVDCVGHWSDYSPCSTTCGCGIQTREFIVDSPAQFGGKQCEHEQGAKEAVACKNKFMCPLDWEVGPWENGPCSATCGSGGTRIRHREILRNSTHPDRFPKPHLQEVISCDLPGCPVDCITGDWEASSCSADCGNGTITKTRKVLQAPLNGGKSCGVLEETEPCFLKHCPLNLKMWRKTVCHGPGVANATELKFFGTRVPGSPECRIMDPDMSITEAMGRCALKCNTIADCSGYVWEESTRKCCFRAGTTNRTHLRENFTCFEALDPSSPLRITESDEDNNSAFGSVMLFIFLAILGVGSYMSLSDSGPKIQEWTPASPDVRSPEADPSTPMPPNSRR